ncbi:MAG TPA: hypothetical protein ENJ12_08350 [Thiolapillus brandeum]|uniref:Acyl transferase n=1 Tax=Thiolapillus brandeum TaxID=1076588 RepID=A0A831RVL6_9GAMM|nr:hypothetical protein [Thiolapillus brandeum]
MNRNQHQRPELFQILLLYFPLAFLSLGGLLSLQFQSVAGGLMFAAAWLYLLPPVTCRITLALFGRPLTRDSTPQDRSFRVWWFLTQLQMPFNRIGLLEELLRLVPGLYGSWLTLWGSRVSPFSFWARDILISERYLLTVEKGAVIASQCGLAGHVVTLDERGNHHLQVAPIVIEYGAMLGIRSGLGPGCKVAAGEMLPAGRMLPPFTCWKDGRKHKCAG